MSEIREHSANKRPAWSCSIPESDVKKPKRNHPDPNAIPLQIGAVQIFQDPMVAGTNDIQELSKTHDVVSRTKTELWHRILTHYLPLYFPEADRFHRSSRTDWFLAFLEMFPSPHMISAMTKEEFIKAPLCQGSCPLLYFYSISQVGGIGR